MGNVIDYIREYGQYSFRERPFSDEDSLILAQFSYLKLENMTVLSEKEGAFVTPEEIEGSGEKDKILDGVFFPEENRALLKEMSMSRRFRKMKIGNCESYTDSQESAQFFAVTFFPEDEAAYIAFRGTDETLAGWKEDFMMAYRSPVRSQELGVNYLDRAGALSDRLYVGGHSKGGNLSVYAAMHCREEVRERIERIYNLDGPGFPEKVRCSADYDRIESRIHKIIPRSSVIGMLLEDTKRYEVVESSSFGVMQHNPFTWIIREGSFVKADDVYKGRKAAGEILNRWIESLTEEEVRGFVEELFDVLERSETETVQEFPVKWKEILERLAESVRLAQPETKKELGAMFRSLCSCAKEVLISDTFAGILTGYSPTAHEKSC